MNRVVITGMTKRGKFIYSDQEVANVRWLRLNGFSNKLIGNLYGMDTGYISDLMNTDTRSDVDPAPPDWIDVEKFNALIERNKR